MERDDAQRLLQGERNRLGQVLDGLHAEHLDTESESDSLGELASFSQHPADVASETFEREKDLGLLEDVEAQLTDIERAFARLDAGTYGHCEVCHQAIPDERLEAMPATRFCMTHQEQGEHAAAMGRVDPAVGRISEDAASYLAPELRAEDDGEAAIDEGELPTEERAIHEA